MCAIVGYLDRDGKGLSSRAFMHMMEIVRHRGPDDSGFREDGGVGLANLRLSIIDVEGGHQPFVSEDRRITVVQNGEIYNYLELADELAGTEFACQGKSDTEVILRLYQRHGIDMLNKLNGMFAIAIYDERAQVLYLARDRVGVKPLYWHDDGRIVRFASEIKAILRSGVSSAICYESMHAYLTFNYVPPPKTMFSGIEHVPPGSFLKVRNGNVTIQSWWSLKERSSVLDKHSAWEEQFLELFTDAVKIRMRSDVPFGAFLSGGIDSSSVVATMADCTSDQIRTFCIGFEDQRFDEARYAEKLAHMVSANHTTSIVRQDMLEIWPLVAFYVDQPHGDVSFMPTYKVAELAAEDVKVVLTGDGGDELFAGYDKYRDFFSDHPDTYDSPEEFVHQYFDCLRLFSPDAQRRLYAGELREFLARDFRDDLTALLSDEQEMDGVNLALIIDFCLLLPGNNLVKPDRMGMANSLEVRTPFLDYRLVEWAFSLPGSAKLNNGITKSVLKSAVSPILGAELTYRDKQMFTVPIGEWFKQGASHVSNQVLFDGRTIDRGIFDAGVVENMMSEHVAGRKNHTRELRALVALELWMRIFIDTQFEVPPRWEDIGFSVNTAA